MPKPLVQFLLRQYKHSGCPFVGWVEPLSVLKSLMTCVRVGVLSPVLFAVYLDSSLDSLCSSGRGCFGGTVERCVMQMIKPFSPLLLTHSGRC